MFRLYIEIDSNLSTPGGVRRGKSPYWECCLSAYFPVCRRLTEVVAEIPMNGCVVARDCGAHCWTRTCCGGVELKCGLSYISWWTNSAFGGEKRKYNHGRPCRTTWVVGGIFIIKLDAIFSWCRQQQKCIYFGPNVVPIAGVTALMVCRLNDMTESTTKNIL